MPADRPIDGALTDARTQPRPCFDLAGKRVWVAGHRGMAGAAVLRRLAREPCEVLTTTRDELDLLRQAEVERWLAATRPDAVVVAAALVGGIMVNATRPAEFLHHNLSIQTNVIHAAWRVGVAKLLFLGSSCMYPRLAAQPIREEALLSGPLEPTNEWYAVAKIAGVKMCEAYRRQYGCDFIALMPCNLYGPGDRYDSEASHVVAALTMKIHAAKLSGAASVELWGSGTPRREFLFCEDLADACVFAMRHYSDTQVLNVGTGTDRTILELAETIAHIAEWDGQFTFDRSRPDGIPRKVMDVSRMRALGWSAPTDFHTGMVEAYRWYVDHVAPAATA